MTTTQVRDLTVDEVHGRLRALADSWSGERAERQRRRELVRADFDELHQAGFLLTGVPVSHGGLWQDAERSTRAVCEMLRTLARADSSVALVASMHPATAVSGRWLPVQEAPPPYTEAWTAQRDWRFQHSIEGHFWGTCTSEPGSGGDTRLTKAEVRVTPEGEYRISGRKHFASGTGICSFMSTTGRVEGDDTHSAFEVDLRGVAWDGSDGVRITAPWDGHGMTATQSHALEFEDFPAIRQALPGDVVAEAQSIAAVLWIAVIVGIVDIAMETAHERLAPRKDSMNAYARAEWTQVNADVWLLHQAYEGALRAVESGQDRAFSMLAGKQLGCDLAESICRRLSRVVGGSSFSRGLPFGFWAEDVRALGFLRPPWNLAYDRLEALSWTRY